MQGGGSAQERSTENNTEARARWASRQRKLPSARGLAATGDRTDGLGDEAKSRSLSCEATDWRAGCGRAACPVRREGWSNSMLCPYPYQMSAHPRLITPPLRHLRA